MIVANMLENWLDFSPNALTTAEVIDEPEISEQQQSKPAYIYVRQSTLAQVRHHQESTERQYALRRKLWNLVGAKRRSASSIGIWEYLVPIRRDARTSRPW